MPDTPAAPRLQLPSSDTPLRERLIDAGAALVAREGSASVGLREIAREAGVSHGAPRRHFPTHHALLSAVARRGFADLTARFTAATRATDPPRTRLLSLGREYVHFAQEQPGMFELMFRHDLLDSTQYGTGQDAPAPPRLRESTLPLFTGVVQLLTAHRELLPAAQRPGLAPELAAAALWSGLHGLARLWSAGSLPLALDGSRGQETGAPDRLDELLAAVLDAYAPPAAR
ncbi:TetR/AcrR family transcriptional regulator [Streptomyces physcomitrii]|uniref:TetR/AcrR family transcriptional regulator n=1 Tax=Streptomyces physcomitrii TaxID=2724184 RepID=A0ABX1H5R1_9ACTN|nr:TetR/AcrR family transcriptional regulator [Streptomyces physcomitrii]NKI43701.1 TetR/AcrR family transcriptional regulator [Streptomyces physcomitrii]